MGMFKSVRDLSKMSKEIQASQPPMQERTAGMVAAMQQSQQMMAALTEAAQLEQELRAGGGTANGIVTTVAASGASVNLSPVLEIEVLVQAPGRPPMPATMRAAVPQHLLHKVTVGATIPLLVEVNGPRVALDSARLAVA
jgi:hypothetical protein